MQSSLPLAMLYVHVSVCVHMGVHVYMHVCVCEGQRSVLCVIIKYSLCLNFFGSWSLTELGACQLSTAD